MDVEAINRYIDVEGLKKLSYKICSFLTACRRLAAVELFSVEIFHSETIVGMLRSCEDIERIIQKVCM